MVNYKITEVYVTARHRENNNQICSFLVKSRDLKSLNILLSSGSRVGIFSAIEDELLNYFRFTYNYDENLLFEQIEFVWGNSNNGYTFRVEHN